jgi:predicted SprT family Zn-dependent metalloprotease
MSLKAAHFRLVPLPYHLEMRDYLKARERELWNWFASARAQADYTENLRLDLLKSTYRLDRETHAELYRGVEEAKTRLELDIPVTVYQAQNSPQTNAALYFIPAEGHIVFSGAALTLLTSDEIKSVIGHELAHYHLWARDGGDFHIADRMLQAVAADPRAANSHQESARRFQLFTEIFCDRGSLCVTGDVHPVISGLVKIETGLAQVSAASYLKQADEIFAKTIVTTAGLSHPEAFIRARALALWQERSDAAAVPIADMIEGAAGVNELDLIGQTRLSRHTRHLLEYFLQPKWFQTSAVLGHARQFFGDFEISSKSTVSELQALIPEDKRFQEYFCYLLLDFVTVDRDLDEMPLAAALECSRQMGIEEYFEKLAIKELKVKVRDFKKLKEQAAQMLVTAGVAGE